MRKGVRKHGFILFFWIDLAFLGYFWGWWLKKSAMEKKGVDIVP